MKKNLIVLLIASVTVSVAIAAVVAGSADFPNIAGNTTTVSQAFLACTTSTSNGTRVVTPPAAGSNCNLEPNEQTISVYSIKLCTSKPTQPTGVLASDLSACESIFESTNNTGSAVNIALKQTVDLTNGTVSTPVAGTYTHLYIELDPEVKIKAEVQFDTQMASTNGTSTGQYCWSKQVDVYNFSMNTQGSLPDATECGTSAPSAASVGATSAFYNSLRDDSGSGGTGFVNTFTNLPTTDGGPSTLDAYLIGSDGKLVATQTVNTMSDVKRVVGIVTLPGSGVTVTAASSGFVLGYNNSLGAQMSTQSGVSPSQISKFGNGPFDVTVSILP